MAVHSCDSSAVAASPAAFAAKLRKSAPIPEPAAVQLRSLVVRSVAGQYWQCGAGKRQHPVATGNPVPASKTGSHRHRQGKLTGFFFQRSEGQRRYMGSGESGLQHRRYAMRNHAERRSHSKIRSDLSGAAHRRPYAFPSGFIRELQRNGDHPVLQQRYQGVPRNGRLQNPSLRFVISRFCG